MIPPQTPSERRTAARIALVRRFNRFYTEKIGVLDDGLLGSAFSLAEVRILYELAHWRDAATALPGEAPTATRLASRLSLDEGYLSRILSGFHKQRLIARKPSPADGREYVLELTSHGRKAFAPLDERSRELVAALLQPLGESDRSRLTGAMATIEQLLSPTRTDALPPFVLRSLRPGDIGWVTHRHGVLYAEEYGYDESFEALVAEIAAHFVQQLDAERERCWIAERNGEILGCVFLVKKDAHRRQAATASGRARGAWPWARRQAGRRVHRLRTARGIPQDRALDPERVARGAARLPAAWIQARGGGSSPQLRPRSGRGNVVAYPVGAGRIPGHPQPGAQHVNLRPLSRGRSTASFAA